MINHRFHSNLADGSNSTLVRASNWNDTHTGTVDTVATSMYECTGNYSVLPGVTGNFFVLASATGNASGSLSVITLPPASGDAVFPGVGNNRCASFGHKIVNWGLNGAILVQVAPGSGDLINKQFTAYELDGFGQFVELFSDGGGVNGGTGWFITDTN
jgi:hypothetical protein